jgi:hypothetical protein
MTKLHRDKPTSALKNARRDLYYLLSGFLNEVYRDQGMLSGGPFNIKDFGSIAKDLLELVQKDPTISPHDKQLALKHYTRCLELYREYKLRPAKALDGELRAKFSADRKEIDEIAKKFLRAKTA